VDESDANRLIEIRQRRGTVRERQAVGLLVLLHGPAHVSRMREQLCQRSMSFDDIEGRDVGMKR
jgi:hypothetical protein